MPKTKLEKYYAVLERLSRLARDTAKECPTLDAKVHMQAEAKQLEAMRAETRRRWFDLGGV